MSLSTFSNLKIGYVPMNPGSYHPFDLKNFIFYAKNRKLNVEIAHPKKSYNVVVLSPKADLSIWSRLPKGNTKIIFCLVDSYLALEQNNIKSAFRGIGKFLTREHKHLKLNYSKSLIEMCKRADSVICTTAEQKNLILKYCRNVHIILESNFRVARHQKSNYQIGEHIKIAWEGRPENIETLKEIKEPLIKLKRKI